MANYATLKTAIESTIRTNGQEEITGQILQNAIIALIESLGAEFQFAGVASTNTNPGTPDYKVMYIAGAGTYPNFGGTVVEKGHIGVFAYNGSWNNVVVETGAYFEFQEYPSGDAIEFTFYDSDNTDGKTIKINKTVSGISNAPDEAISQWWAAQIQRKIQDVQGFTDNFTSLSTTEQSLGLFGIIKTGKVIDSITGVNKLIFIDDESNEYTVNTTDLPYVAPADFVSVKLQSGTASNVSINVRGDNDVLISHININEIANHPTAYTSAALALNDVPTLYRRKGMKVVYYDDTLSLWVEMLNVDDAGANWWTDVTNNWVIEGPIETELPTNTGGQQLRVGGTKRGNLDDVLNVNVWNNQATEYSSKDNARAAVPTNKRKLGAIITYLVSTGTDTSGWMIDEFTGSSISDWAVADNWKTIGPVSVSQNTETGHTNINIGDTTIPVASVEEVSQLGQRLTSELHGSNINQVYSFKPGYIITNTNSEINIDTPVSSSEYQCAVIPCQEGDIFTVNVLGGSNPRGWAFLNPSKVKILMNQGTSVEWETITAPTDAAYLVVNDKMSKNSSCVKGSTWEQDSLLPKFNNLQLAFYPRNGYINNSMKWVNVVNGNGYKHIVIPVSINGAESLSIKASANGQSIIAFLSAYNPVEDGDASVLRYVILNANVSLDDYAIPSETKFIYCLYYSFPDNRIPQILKINDVDLLSGTKNGVFSIQKYVSKVQGYVKDSHRGYINNNKWNDLTSGARFYSILDISGCDEKEITFVGNSSYQSVVAFLSDYNPVEGGTAGVVGTLKTLSVSEKWVTNVPDGARYIYVLSSSSKESRIPSSIHVGKINLLGTIAKNILELGNSCALLTDIEYKLRQKHQGYINAGVWTDIDTGQRFYKLVDIDGISGTLKVKGNSIGQAVIAFLSSYAPTDGQSTGIMDGGGVVNSGQTRTFEIPSGAKYIYYLYMSYGEDRTPAELSIGSVDLFASVKQNLANIGTSIGAKGILDFNPESVVLPKLLNLKNAYRTLAQNPTKECLTLLHFSDVHNEGAAMDRINVFAENYSNYIDDIIHTGDLLGLDLNNSINAAWRSGWLNVIGNHDATYKVNGVYTLAPQSDSYDKIFAPYINEWDVESAGENLCYYYKDYISKGFRLIVLDNMTTEYISGDPLDNHWNTAQKDWFVEKMAETRDPNNAAYGLHVIVAVHYPAFVNIKIGDNPFDSIDYSPNQICNSEIPQLVKAHIDAGGVFVCYLTGHTHYNLFGLNATYPNQLMITIPTASVQAAENYDDEARENGNKTQDCFDLISFDAVSKTIKILRIGADYDRYMRRKNTISWNYNTNQIIYVD